MLKSEPELKEEKKTFEWYVEEGRKAVAVKDMVQWKLGELASSVQKEYGKSKFKEWCNEIDLEVSTAKRYRWVYRYWSKKFDSKLFEKLIVEIPWSYFEVALRFKKYGMDPLAVLTEAIEKGYSVTQLKIALVNLKKKRYTAKCFPIEVYKGIELPAFNFVDLMIDLPDYKFLKEINDRLNLGFKKELKAAEWIVKGILEFVRISREKLMDELLAFLKSKLEAKTPMSFTADLIPKILEGKKTMTTRKEKSYDKGDIVPFVAREVGYDSRREGRYLLITGVYEKRLGDYTDEDAKKEGFNDLNEFKQYWKEKLEKYYESWDDDNVFWVYKFELL
jgi:uncharacterized protein YhfF